MKLSTNSRYGLRALVDLAASYNGEPQALCAIAERQHISESYLEQAFSTLRKAGFVKSVKGAQGGYVPAADTGSTKVGAILRTLEGDLAIVEHSPVYSGTDPIKRCIKSNLWDAIDTGVGHMLDSITLRELAEEYMRMRGNALDYQI